MEHSAATQPSETVREVRLGLVFNGGVSLAVWMGGVTHEIDSARRAESPGDGSTTKLYHELLSTILRQRVRVDVIAGASAGGINGTLLAAAIATGQALPSLRDTWIELGDLASLMRAPSRSDPPSLLQGNEILLKAVRRKLDALMVNGLVTGKDHGPLYLYVTATNLHGRENIYYDSTGREFRELDSRHKFSFELLPEELATSRRSAGVRRDDDDTATSPPSAVTSLASSNAAELLSRAARASSSFPGAFEAAGPFGPDREWFIDGGVLDNQPFVPVLDRIAVLPATGESVKRVVAYIVPYINEPVAGKGMKAEEEAPSALKTVTTASKLPRSLSKLQSLDRVTADDEAQSAAEAHRALIQQLLLGDNDRPPVDLREPAKALIDVYRQTRRLATLETFARWKAKSFVPGDGRAGQDPTIAVAAMAAPVPWQQSAELSGALWLPDSGECDWARDDAAWRWGLSPAERVATWALLVVRDALVDRPTDSTLIDARKHASRLIWDIRTLKQQLSENFRRPALSELPLPKRANQAYRDLKGPSAPLTSGVTWLQERFARLDELMAAVSDLNLPDVQTLLDVEVVRNALKIDDDPPFPFDFVFMSAGIDNSLGHEFSSPEQKLAGMKLGHFGGFMKRSWRANDWLWGRLDGVEHVLRATFDRPILSKLAKSEDPRALARKLAHFAFAADPLGPDDTCHELPVLRRQWEKSVMQLPGPVRPAAGSACTQFQELLTDAIAENNDAALEACRAALAARIQLQVLAEELPTIASAAESDVESGTSPTVSGAVWARDLRATERAARGRHEHKQPPADDNCLGENELVALFQDMKIGAEDLKDEVLSKAGVDVAAQALAVVTASLAGARGGLPVAARAALRGLRAATLALSYGVRLLARRPWAGAGVIAALCALAYIASKSSGTVLGTLSPTLVMLSVALVGVLLVIATGALGDSQRTVTRILAFVGVVGVPFTLGVLAFDLMGTSARDWMVDHAGEWPTNIAAGLSIVSAMLALIATCLFLSRSPKALTRARGAVNGYRMAVLVGAAVVATGVLVDRFRAACTKETTGCSGWDWQRIADERAGIAIGLGFLAALLVAALLVEFGASVQQAWKRWRAARR